MRLLPDFIAIARKWLEGFEDLVIESWRSRLNTDDLDEKGFAIVSGFVSDCEGKKHGFSVYVNRDGTIVSDRSGLLEKQDYSHPTRSLTTDA